MIVLLPSEDNDESSHSISNGQHTNNKSSSSRSSSRSSSNNKKNKRNNHQQKQIEKYRALGRQILMSMAFLGTMAVAIRNFQHVQKDIASLSEEPPNAPSAIGDTPSIFTRSFASFHNNTHQQKQSLSSSTTSSKNHPDIFAHNPLIPQWMRDYFQWHHTIKSNLTPQNMNQTRYIVMTCFKGRKCGGSTDRIRPIAAFIKLAYQSQRLLLIYWERPYPLEEFLLPPIGGLDWRTPNWLKPYIWEHRYFASNIAFKRIHTNVDQYMLFQYQSWNYGELWYKDNTPTNETFIYDIYKDIWTATFTPSLPIAQRIRNQLKALQLIPGEYATAHMRVLYAIKERSESSMKKIVHNAMNCVSNLRPGGPYFVASDHNFAIEEAKRYGQLKNVTVVYAYHDKEPLHLGLHPENDPNVTGPQDFYDAFVDMYLVAHTRCKLLQTWKKNYAGMLSLFLFS